MKLPSPFALKILHTAGEARRQGSPMNELRSALTAGLAGQPDPKIRAKGAYECGLSEDSSLRKLYTMCSVRCVYYVPVRSRSRGNARPPFARLGTSHDWERV